MSFADPTSIAVGATVSSSGGTATSCAAVDRSQPYQGVYSTADGLQTLTVTHIKGSRTRSTFRLDLYTTYTDPSTGLTNTVSAATYLVLNRPVAGFTNAQLQGQINALCAFLGASANQLKFLGLES
jgi:hypothetical protein